MDAAGNVVDAGVGKLEEVAGGVAEGAVEKTALWIGNAGVAVLKFALGWWITGTEMDGDTFQDTVATVNDYTFYIQVAALSLSLILLGGRLALARSGAIRDTSEEGLKQLARAVVLAGGATTMIVLGTRLSDQISAWFLGSAVGSDPSRLAEAMVSIYLYAGPAGVGLLFLIGLIGMLGGLMMAFLMLLRTGILVLMAAALPIAGAAGGTKVGSQAFEKMLAWTIAFLLVKPVGAFVIGVSAILFLEATPTITDPENGDGFMALSGVITLCAAALVLPALMRLIVPNVGALGGGGSGMAAAAGAAAAGAKVGAKVGGMIATGGASGAASGAATTSSTSTSMGNPPSGAQTGGAPSGFGAAGGEPAGNQQGTPSGGGAGAAPQGNQQGTPSGGGASGQPGGNTSGTPGGRSSGDTAAAAVVASGAGQQFHRGGFEQ
ncbi:putative integral membrane protein [Rhodococcus ruber BKS 20-38]|uniref:Putative integral membrane protein n=1 Tax=Rhodococcus ruber BKS 20-38 TaxID=1278076 RepID=M2ZCP1_9NOCA|nr:putative integral membrane protein [Rhodococcus ruber BKS 20-38]